MVQLQNLSVAECARRAREVQRMVWRSHGEGVVELPDLKTCAEHAVLGGCRSAALAFNLQSSINLALALVRIHKVPKGKRFAAIRKAMFGPDSFRAAAMLATFVSVYKFLINGLPFLLPVGVQRLFQPTDGEPSQSADTEGSTATKDRLPARKRTRRWHAALAGTLAGGLAILWEKRSNRLLIAQQAFARGLQSSYNTYAAYRGLRIPHGDVLVFTLAMGQILYAWLLRPETLPKAYCAWISQSSKVPAESARICNSLVRTGKFNVADLDKILARKNITAANAAVLRHTRDLATSSAPSFPPFIPCEAVHPSVTSCLVTPLDRFVEVFKWMLPVYGALQLLPLVAFRGRQLASAPRNMLLRTGMSTARSAAFLSAAVTTYQAMFCLKHIVYTRLNALPASSALRPPQRVIDFFVSKTSYWIPALLAGLSLLIEDPRRRAELAMYVLPRALESLWTVLRGRGIVPATGKHGATMLSALGMGMVMSAYQNDPQHLSGFVGRVLYQVVGPN